MKHTPGPWEADNIGSLVWQTENKHEGMMVADIRGWGFLTGFLRKPEKEAIEIQKANAHLIAASPELLTELEAADEEICNLCVRLNPRHKNCTSCDERDARLKAITKARGTE